LRDGYSKNFFLGSVIALVFFEICGADTIFGSRDDVIKLLTEISPCNEDADFTTELTIEYVIYLFGTLTISARVLFVSQAVREYCEARKAFLYARLRHRKSEHSSKLLITMKELHENICMVTCYELCNFSDCTCTGKNRA